MRRTALFLILCSTLLFSASIDSKIKQKKRELSSKKNEYKKMDKKLSMVAKKIIEAKEERDILDEKLKALEKSIQSNQNRFNSVSQKQHILEGELTDLNQEIKSKKEKFVALVADKFSMALVLEEIKQPTLESVMLEEAYKVYANANDKKIDGLKEDIGTLKSQEKNFVTEQKSIKISIEDYQKERNEYRLKKEKQTQLIKELARDKAIYKKRFDRIRASRRVLQKKLSKLKIIKHDKEEVSYSYSKKDDHSTRRVKTANYRGKKTISPLAGSRLIKKFGTYIDPIYKFKIFNKSITLKAPHKGSKVKNVLNGKIVFAENSGGMLGKVVIVEHPNKLHTIYAKLSRLAPGIHVGKRLLKGAVIGKVKSSLMFEVTKNNKHMNPLKLIRI